MHYARTAKMMERSVMNQHFNRQATTLLKRTRPMFGVAPASIAPISTVRFASTTVVVHPPKADERYDPTNVTNEPAYKAHFKQSPSRHPLGPTTEDGEPIWENPTNHAVYNLDKITTMEQTHHPITKMHERVAYLAVKALRMGFDVISGYRGPGGAMTEKDWLNRCLFLESVAGVPGMVGGMLRHLRSLRLLKRDYGWIHTLLEEAENERMHLLIFMNIKQPGYFFRALVVGTQGLFFNGFFLTYLVSPKTCHRFVGYLEEEAVKTYTCLLQDIDDGHLDVWKQKKAPLIAQTYYKLPEDASVHDMVKCIRADEANHRDVNHAFANLDQKKGVSPFVYSHH
ncbi:Alternative oxidase, mitochondrial [Phytophthora ramorum]|uniref:Alternative oxidase n=1 Tax=Phytophthora ramorum TaxID=164328 RepID=H3GKW0_PHYRM|nr:Alternative oxidase, mitochondrial [Phytophthora ramorum]